MKKQPFQIGDLVKVSGLVRLEYTDDLDLDNLKPDVSIVYSPKSIRNRRILLRYPIDQLGVVVGWTVKRTGIYYPGYAGDYSPNGYAPPEQAYLDSNLTDYHKVWIIHLLNVGQRYRKSVIALEEDISLVERH
jgi:hypothetical protein